MGSNEPLTLPYWQVNAPTELQSESCPEFLANLNAKDTAIISTPDSQYHVLTWAEVRQIIADNRLDLFQRVPSDLRRYLSYIFQIKREYGSVMEFVLTQRLDWKVPIRADGEPFEKESDLKILWNDWPYGIDERIVHLVVWTKFDLEDDPATDDLTDRARKEIDDFVDMTFGSEVGKENVIWFKNWKVLKSVHAVEHFHVMLFDPKPAFVEEITNGDIALSQKVSRG